VIQLIIYLLFYLIREPKETRQKYASPTYKPIIPAPENSRKTKLLRALEIYCFIFRELGKLLKTLPNSRGNFKHSRAGSPFFLACPQVVLSQIKNDGGLQILD